MGVLGVEVGPFVAKVPLLKQHRVSPVLETSKLSMKSMAPIHDVSPCFSPDRFEDMVQGYGELLRQTAAFKDASL